MANKLYITEGFRAVRYPTYDSFGDVTEELGERFGIMRGVETRILVDEGEELPRDAREPSITLVRTGEVKQLSWPAGQELDDVYNAIENGAPGLLEPLRVTLAEVACNFSRKGSGFVNIVPEHTGAQLLATERSSIIDLTEEATDAVPHTWPAIPLDITIAHIDAGTSERTLDQLVDHVWSLLPMDVVLEPVEFYPDPRFDD
jgi:hypothetical protein